MKCRILFLAVAFSPSAFPQAWSTFLDRSRAIDWTSAGFTIANYTINCSIQPVLTGDDATAAAANTAAIQNALASCDETHNVVNIPAGIYYVAGWVYGSQGKQVVRGTGPKSTTVILTTAASCGFPMGICMAPAAPEGHGVSDVIPPTGARQCRWTGGLAKGSTTITLDGCPNHAGPPLNTMLVLDQANDAAETGGVYLCDTSTDRTYSQQCTNAGPGGGNNNGRIIDGVTHSQQQVVTVTGVTGTGSGPYTVTISRPVYFSNVRPEQSPGAWWLNRVQGVGLEDLTVDHGYASTNTPIAMINCYQCWIKNVRSLEAVRAHVFIFDSLDDVVRDSYFYGAQRSGNQSYGIELEVASGVLIENNIFQQATTPIMFGQGSGDVIGYNYSVDNRYGRGTWMMLSASAHNAGSEMNLWEGNNLNGIVCDGSTWGTSTQGTVFRNLLNGWQSGKTNGTYPLALEHGCRGYNVAGNVMGQPNYHGTYESYATSSSEGRNGGSTANGSIYNLGWTGIRGVGGCSGPPECDPVVRATLMRWGNYDTVTGGIQWDATDASPGATPFLNSNFTSSYFSTVAQTLPASLYYSSIPCWWPANKAWPPVGPDVSSGNLGICSGTYAGAQATASGQCKGGRWASAWAGHANSIPAQDCYLKVMHGPPDGTGNVLNFDARLCYSGGPGTKPANVTGAPPTAR